MSQKEWEPLVPAPTDLRFSIDSYKHHKHGKPSAVYPYANADGIEVTYQLRFDLPDGGKTFQTISFGILKGQRGWHPKAIPSGRPLFNAGDLLARPDAPVLIVEGEKAATAAAGLFPDFVSITWQGGSNAVSKTDWSLLRGRPLYLVPDNDEAGHKAADAIIQKCAEIGAKRVHQLLVGNRFPKGWDMADELPNGVAMEAFTAMVRDAATVECKLEAKKSKKFPIPPSFRLTDTHVEYFKAGKSEDENGEWVKVCSRFEVTALTRDVLGKNWGRLIEFIDRDGRHHRLAIPMQMLAGDGQSYRQILLNQGLEIEPGANANKLLHQYISSCEPGRKVQCVDRIGWHVHGGDVSFVMPDRVMGCQDVVLQTDDVPAHAFAVKGTLQEWNDNIAKYAVGNPHLMQALCTALAAVLLESTELGGGGFHFVGPSSTGKTSLLVAAGSVFGGGGEHGFTKTWRATANGLEAHAQQHNDTILCLDEIGQASSDDVGEIIYMLANGQGKSRAKRTGLARQQVAWRTLLLSTGELSISAKIGEGGKTTRAGQTVRIIDIPVAGRFGIFDDLHGFENGAALADHLRAASRKSYGTAGPAFIEALIGIRGGIKSCIQRVASDFMEIVSLPSNADGQVIRVAQRFALLVAAGQLATELGIVRWGPTDALGAISTAFQEWLKSRGGPGPQEVDALVSQVRGFFQQYGDSYFVPLGKDGSDSNRVPLKRYGFREDKDEEGTHFYVFPKTAAETVFAGFHLKWAEDVLVGLGMLRKGSDRATAKRRLPGATHPQRVYHFLPAVLGGEPTREGASLDREGNLSQKVGDKGDGGDKEGVQADNLDVQGFQRGSDVPSPEQIRKVADHLFAKAFAHAKRSGAGLPPQFDDMTARCINLLGGWAAVAKRWPAMESDAARDEFRLAFEKFALHKVSGFYDTDALPLLRGELGAERAFRGSWNALLREVADEK